MGPLRPLIDIRLAREGLMAFRGLSFAAILMVLPFTLACGGAGSNAAAVPLSPARNLAGTWKTTVPVRVNYKTDFCTFGVLQDVSWVPWAVTFVITPGADDNHVIVDMSFQTGTTTIVNDCGGSGTGAVPEVSPMFLTGAISSTNLVLYNGTTQVGNFNFTTDNLTGTFDYTWSMVYTQEEYTATNGFILTRQ